jgi:hypothetical protein
MNFRPTKITKFFPNESSTNHFFPPTIRIKKEKKDGEEVKEEREMTEPPKTPAPISSFDQFSIALATRHSNSNNTVHYCIYFGNSGSKTITNTIKDTDDPVSADLQALLECLQYIVYYPTLFQKINRQKIVIYTNSENITKVFKPTSDFLSNNVYSKLYFKLQSLIKCIKHISIQIQKTSDYPISHAINVLSITN